MCIRDRITIMTLVDIVNIFLVSNIAYVEEGRSKLEYPLFRIFRHLGYLFIWKVI